MVRSAQNARKSTSGSAPRKQLATHAARKSTSGSAPRKQLLTSYARKSSTADGEEETKKTTKLPRKVRPKDANSRNNNNNHSSSGNSNNNDGSINSNDDSKMDVEKKMGSTKTDKIKSTSTGNSDDVRAKKKTRYAADDLVDTHDDDDDEHFIGMGNIGLEVAARRIRHPEREILTTRKLLASKSIALKKKKKEEEEEKKKAKKKINIDLVKVLPGTVIKKIFMFLKPSERVEVFSVPSFAERFKLEDHFCKKHGTAYLVGAKCAGDDSTIVGKRKKFKSFQSPYDKIGSNYVYEDPEERKKDPEEGEKIGPIDRSSKVADNPDQDHDRDQDHDQSAISSSTGQSKEERIGIADISTILREIKADGKNPQEFLEKLSGRFTIPDGKKSSKKFPPHCPLSDDPVYGTYFRRLQKCLACEWEAREVYLEKMGLQYCEYCDETYRKRKCDNCKESICPECQHPEKCDNCKKWFGNCCHDIEIHQCAGFKAGLACCQGAKLCSRVGERWNWERDDSEKTSEECGGLLRPCSGVARENCENYCCEQTSFCWPSWERMESYPGWFDTVEVRCFECMEAEGWRPNIPRRDESEES